MKGFLGLYEDSERLIEKTRTHSLLSTQFIKWVTQAQQ